MSQIETERSEDEQSGIRLSNRYEILSTDDDDEK